MYRLFIVRCGVSRRCDLCRSSRADRRKSFFARRAVRQTLRNKFVALHLLRILRNDVQPVKRALKHNNYDGGARNHEHNFLEFNVNQIPALRGLDVEVGISWNVLEEREAGAVVREVRIDLTSPSTFDLATDI